MKCRAPGALPGSDQCWAFGSFSGSSIRKEVKQREAGWGEAGWRGLGGGYVRGGWVGRLRGRLNVGGAAP